MIGNTNIGDSAVGKVYSDIQNECLCEVSKRVTVIYNWEIKIKSNRWRREQRRSNVNGMQIPILIYQ